MGLKWHRPVGLKLEIVSAYESAERGARGEVLRRYGVDRGSVARWAFARDNEEFGPSPTGHRVLGRAMTPRTQSAEIARLRKELAKALADRDILEAALVSVGKAHALLERLAESAEPEPLQPASRKPLSRNSLPPD
jgi:transposase